MKEAHELRIDSFGRAMLPRNLVDDLLTVVREGSGCA